MFAKVAEGLFTHSLLARILKVGAILLGGSGGMLPKKILKNWSLLDVISAILTSVNVKQPAE